MASDSYLAWPLNDPLGAALAWILCYEYDVCVLRMNAMSIMSVMLVCYECDVCVLWLWSGEWLKVIILVEKIIWDNLRCNKKKNWLESNKNIKNKRRIEGRNIKRKINKERGRNISTEISSYFFENVILEA